jgi:hypothetical protein
LVRERSRVQSSLAAPSFLFDILETLAFAGVSHLLTHNTATKCVV